MLSTIHGLIHLRWNNQITFKRKMKVGILNMSHTLSINLRVPWSEDGSATVELPKEFKHYPDKDWHLGIEEFKCFFENKSDANVIMYVDQIDTGTITTKNFNTSNVLAIIPTNSITYEPQVITYVRLHEQVFNHLNLKLLNLEGRPIQFKKRECYIRVRITNMASNNDQFMLRFNWDTMDSFYTDTTKTFKLNHPIYFEKNSIWKVAIESVSYPAIQTEKDIFYECLITFNNEKTYVKIPQADVKNEADFLREFQKACALAGIPRKNITCIVSKINNNRVIFFLRKGPKVTIDVDRDLGYILGNCTYGYNKAAASFTLISKTDKDKFSYPFGFDVNRVKPKFAKLSCDITSPVAMNNKFESLLAILPIDGNDQLVYQPKHLDYIDIDATFMESITFKLRDMYDFPVPFAQIPNTPFCNVMINAHFKKFK